MTIPALMEVIANVPTMGGDPLSEIIAPSEIRAIAQAIVDADLATSAAAAYPPHLAWMATIPVHMRDCFAS